MNNEAKKTDEAEIEKAWHIVCTYTNKIHADELTGAMLKIAKCVANYDIELRDAKIAAARRACQLTLEIEPCRTKSLEDLWPSEQVLKIVMAKFEKELDNE